MTRCTTKLLVAAVFASACGQDITPPPVRNLDRPSAVAFGCFGDLRLTGGDPGAEGDIVASAQPIESCLAHLGGEPPPGQEELVRPRLYGFVVQSAKGTVAVIDAEVQAVLDSDPLTPGKNSIPIGTLPVGLAPDQSGCFMVSANAGSCDMTTLDVSSAVAVGQPAAIARVPITTPSGELIRAKPRTIVGGSQSTEIGFECPAEPTGVMYVAYPSCNAVAVVDAATGVVQAGIEFAEDGTVSITDGELSCPSECGDGSIVPAGSGSMAGLPPVDAGAPDAGVDAGPMEPPTFDDDGPRPVAIHLGKDGLVHIGAENSAAIASVAIDATGLPTSVTTVRVEGDVGITQLTVSDVIAMGGDLGSIGGSGGDFRFMYAVATDKTVRVIDLGAMVECDTQVDPRYLYDVRDLGLLACLPVGGPNTPPRRAEARSPGIELPREAVPLDVAFARVEPDATFGEPNPIDMIGYFAFVTSSDGFVYVVNVDDDNYPDFEDPDDPMAAAIPLALPHQIRDFVRNRNLVAGNCQQAGADVLELGPRAAEEPVATFSTNNIVEENLHLLPSLRRVSCDFGEDKRPVSELSFNAPVDIREVALPDLKAVANEVWSIRWEGALSRDSQASDVDGPPVRQGLVRFSDGQTFLDDAGEPFCQLGVERFDTVQLLGCEPSLGNAQCGLDETCYVHPDTPATVASGVCLPSGMAETLAGRCREFLTTERRYAVRKLDAGRLALGHRRRVLRTTPLAGCASDAQCEDLAAIEEGLVDPAHPRDKDPTALATTYDWTCADDPTRDGPAQCMISCESSEDCEPGTACNQGVCVEGVMPPPECVRALQRYQVRASDAFVVIGSRTGYLHPWIQAEDSKECVLDPDANPLVTARIPLDPPACTGDGLTDLSPNPCSTTIEHSEDVTVFEEDGGRCVPQSVSRTRETDAVRFRNPVFTIHLADITTQGDAVCLADQAGDAPPFSPLFQGLEYSFQLTGGFFPMFVTPIEAAFPVRIVPAPDGRLWVLDAGDSSATTNGRVYTLHPETANDAFSVVLIL